jgi:hypothetical protein
MAVTFQLIEVPDERVWKVTLSLHSDSTIGPATQSAPTAVIRLAEMRKLLASGSTEELTKTLCDRLSSGVVKLPDTLRAQLSDQVNDWLSENDFHVGALQRTGQR